MWTTPPDIEALYRRHSFAVLRRCRQILGEDAEAEEMTQEVFVRLLENPNGFAGRAEITTYLYSIATHLCLNRLRHARLRHAAWQDNVRLATLWQSADTQHTNPESSAVHADLVATILQEHDTTNALIALYHFVDGLSQGEIATMVQLSRVTVNQRLARFVRGARQKLGEVA